MIYSTKIAIKTVVVLGWAVFGGVLYAQAPITQDPYPSFGEVAQVSTIQRPTMQGPMLPNFSVLPSFSRPTSGVQLGSRSERLERIAQDADRHTKKAFELASRSAHFSARAEFVRALRLIAQGLDSERHCRAYSQSLRAGLKALEEVDDFIPTGAQLESDLPLREIIARHQTTALKYTLTNKRLAQPKQTITSEDWPERSEQPSDFSFQASSLSLQADLLLPTPLEAVGAYLRYAQEQLSIAVGGEIAGSMALHGLGKLYATRQGTELDISLSRAIVCFRVSTIVCPQNYLAYNDLGVLLARSGRSSDACRVFEESLVIHPHPTTLANLAAVYHALGQTELVDATRRRMASYQKLGHAKSKMIPSVDWVSPEKFSESYARTPDARQLPPVRQPSNTKAEQSIKQSVKQADRSWPWNWMKR